MKKVTLLIVLFVFSIGSSQTLLQGFESGGVNGGAFGNMPAPVREAGTGSNTSQVLKIVGNTGGQPWQGINLFLSPSIDLTVNKTMTIDVLSSTPITFLVKVDTGGATAAAPVTHNGDGTWQTLSFTFDTPLDGQSANPSGTYSGFVIHAYWAAGATGFFNPTVPTPARTFYVDNIREPAPAGAPVNDVTGDIYINDGTFAAGDFSTAAGQDSSTFDGSAAEPFATLDYALARSTQAPGDVIYIDAGTYSWSSTHTLATSGTLADPITIQGKGNETNITTTAASTTSAGLHFTTGNHWVVKDLNWTATAARAVWVAAATDITLDNCTINMTSASQLQSIIIGTAGGELTIKNCTLTRSNTAFHMVEVVAGTSLTMQDNTSTFSALSAVGNASSVKITPNASSVFIIERNKFINGGYGMHFNTGVPATAANASSIIKNNFFKTTWGLINQSITGLKVYNNSFYTNGESIYGISTGFLTDWDIQNNILYTYSSSKACIFSNSATSHPAVMNNNHYYSPNTGAGQQTGAVLSFTAWQNAAGGPWEANGQGGNAASFNPLYVDAANGDLHLQPGSPAIGAGANVGITDDIDGDTRPLSGPFDIGADQYFVTVSSDATLSDLQVNGVTIPGFNPAVNNYTFAATSFTSVPVITATKNSLVATGPVITQATDFFENATVQITAEDGTTIQTYTVTIAVDGSDIIQDFEPAATYTGLQGVQSLTASVESNPAAPDGLSLKMVSSTGGQPWQEAFFRQTVAADYFDFTVNKTIQIDVYSDRAFHMLAKVQRTTFGSPASQVAASYTTPNQWQTLTFTFDASANTVATGIYQSISLFPNSDGTNGDFVAPQNFTVYADNVRVPSTQTERSVYTYESDAWTPRTPMGVSRSIDNLSVINGTAIMNAAVEANDIEIASGASLEANSADVSIAGNLVNNGAITGSNQVILNSATAAVSGTGTMTNLTVGGSGVATITGSQSITAQLDVISGGTLNANGNITLVSNALGTARVDEMDAGAITGDVTVERYIPAGNRAFRFIGPTVSGPTVFNSWQEGGATAAAFGTHITGTLGTAGTVNATSGHDETSTGNASMFKWNNTDQDWITVANTKTEVLNAETFYRIFIRGDRTTDLSSNTAAITATTLRSSGSLMQNPMVVTPGIANGAFFAVANPYQSKVSMATTASGTAADMYYWDPNIGPNGSYSTIGISSGIGTAGSATNVLDPGQAVFFVDASAAASVTISQSNKVAGNDNAGIFSAINSQQVLRLKLYQTSRYNNNKSESDGLYIDFNAAHNLNVDLNDAIKLNGLNVNMAIEKPTGERLAVERRTLPNTAETINLNLSNYLTSNYTMAAEVDVLPGLTAYLKDNFNGNMTELVQGTSTAVDFTVDMNNALSMDAARFEIVFQTVTLGNENFAFGDQLSLYPNPVHGDVITISMDQKSASSIEVAVFNTLGQQVMTRSYDQVTNTLEIENLSSLSNGLYFVKVSSGKQQATLKFIKE